MIDEARPNYSDETIRRFLLGRLEATEQALFEQSLFMDDDLEERVRLAEVELADEYASDRLTLTDLQTFRDRFLLTKDRARLLTVSKALYENLTPAPIVRDAALFRFGDLFNLRRHVWKYAFALLILLLALTTALLVKKERLRLVNTGVPKPQHALPQPSANQTPVKMGHAPNSSAPPHRETSPALPLHEGLTTSVVLVSGTSLDSSPVISVNGDVLKIELMLDQPLAASYDVDVLTTSGESVFSATALKRDDNETLSFDVPTSALTAGDFQIEVRRNNSESKGSAETYYLRVR